MEVDGGEGCWSGVWNGLLSEILDTSLYNPIFIYLISNHGTPKIDPYLLIHCILIVMNEKAFVKSFPFWKAFHVLPISVTLHG